MFKADEDDSDATASVEASNIGEEAQSLQPGGRCQKTPKVAKKSMRMAKTEPRATTGRRQLSLLRESDVQEENKKAEGSEGRNEMEKENSIASVDIKDADQADEKAAEKGNDQSKKDESGKMEQSAESQSVKRQSGKRPSIRKTKEAKSIKDATMEEANKPSDSTVAQRYSVVRPKSRSIDSESDSSFKIVSHKEVVDVIEEEVKIFEEDDINDKEKMLCSVVEESSHDDVLIEKEKIAGKMDDQFTTSDAPIFSKDESEKSNADYSRTDKLRKIGKFKINRSLLQNDSSKSHLLKLTSEVFEKIAFKITKEDLLNGQSSKSENGNSVSTTNEQESLKKILEQDVISVKTDASITANGNKLELSSALDPKIEPKDLYFHLNREKTEPVKAHFRKSAKEERQILKKSVIGPDFEQKESSSKRETATQKMKRRRQKSEETAGPGWYNLPKTEVTDEIKQDLKLIKMRGVLDPKRFYKKGEKKISKYGLFLMIYFAFLVLMYYFPLTDVIFLYFVVMRVHTQREKPSPSS